MSMPRGMGLAVALGLTSPWTLSAAPPTISSTTADQIAQWYNTNPPADIRSAIVKLADNDFSTREDAQQYLELKGFRYAKSLAHFRKTERDAEARRRIDDILRKTSWNDIAIARTISLSVRQVTAVEALRLIADKAGYALAIDVNGEQLKRQSKYDFDFNSLTFWDAIDRVCRQSGYTVTPDEEGSLRVHFQDSYDPIAAYSGPFRIIPNQIYAGRYLQLGGLSRRQLPQKNQENLTINFVVSSEPKTPIVGYLGCRVKRVLDQNGKVIPAPPIEERASQYYSGSAYKSYSQNLNMSFDRPSVDSTSLKEITGVVSLMILSEVKRDLMIPDLAKAKGRKAQGRGGSVTINDVTENAGNVTNLTLTIAPGVANGPADYSWVNSIGQRVEIHDARGIAYSVQMTSTNYQNDGAAVVTFQIVPPEGRKPGPATTLIINEWITKTMDVEFSFKDVPLP